MAVNNSIESQIGNTPIVRLDEESYINANLYIKLEGNNLAGSVKDRPALFMLKKAVEKNDNFGKIILTASSGSLATSMAVLGAIFKRKIHVVTTQKLTKEKLDFIKLFGAKITSHGKFTMEAVQYCRDNILKKYSSDYIFIDQLHDWDATVAHYETTGREIYRDIPSVKSVFFSLGSGATLYGVAKYLKERNPQIKIFAVTSSRGTLLPGTGSFNDGDYKTPFILKGYEDRLFDFTEEITHEDAMKGVESLRKQGIFAGPQSGGVYSAMVAACKTYALEGDVLMISGDTGWKNMVSLSALK